MAIYRAVVDAPLCRISPCNVPRVIFVAFSVANVGRSSWKTAPFTHPALWAVFLSLNPFVRRGVDGYDSPDLLIRQLPHGRDPIRPFQALVGQVFFYLL